MKGFWTALTVVFCSVCVLAGCNDYNNSIQTSTGATITNVSPSGVSAGAPSDLTITVIASLGNPFPTGTVVEWNGVKLVSTLIDSVTVTAVVPKAYLTKPGTAYVNTYAKQSGTGLNGLSNALAFLIYGAPNPVPTLASISPATAPACGSSCSNVSVSLTVTGTNFLPTSTNGGTTVAFASPGTPNGQQAALTITSMSATQIVATIPGAFLTAAGTATVSVINPPSGVCVLPYCQPLVGGGPNPANQNQTFTITGSTSNTAAAVAEETPAISQDGRYVAYTAQQNGISQIFLRDTCVGGAKDCAPETHVVSLSSDNAAGNADSHTPSMSPDGRYIAYSSASTNLVAGAPTGRQIFLRDTCLGAPGTCKAATTLISTDSQGALTGTESILPSVSSGGRFVAFVAVTPAPQSQAAPRIAGTNSAATAGAASAGTNSGLRQVFIRDTCAGVADCTPKTTRISLEPGDGQQDNSKPAGPALSGLAKQIALANGKSATVFTPTVPVDDRVFLAITNETK
jgi:hypothetical protein